RRRERRSACVRRAGLRGEGRGSREEGTGTGEDELPRVLSSRACLSCHPARAQRVSGSAFTSPSPAPAQGEQIPTLRAGSQGGNARDDRKGRQLPVPSPKTRVPSPKTRVPGPRRSPVPSPLHPEPIIA